jgi:carbamoyl-phosphate synthase large subunit
VVRKLSDGRGPDNEPTIVDRIAAGEVDLIVNTPFGNSGQRLDGYEIRTAAVVRGIPCLTTVQALGAAVQGIEALRGGEVGVAPLQRHHALIIAARGQGGTTQNESSRSET